MPNYGTYAICPYFQSEDPLRIKCEGIIKLNKANTETVLRFPSSKIKKDWISRYCEAAEYGKCPYAAILNRKYEKIYPTGQISKPEAIKVKPESVAPKNSSTVKKKKRPKDKNIKGQMRFEFKEVKSWVKQ